MNTQPLRKGTNVRGEIKRRRLLEAAGEVFSRRGYDGANLREIAAKADAQASALIYHFGSKQALFRETLHYYVIEQGNLPGLFDVFQAEEVETAQDFSNALLTAISRVAKAFHGPKGRVPNLSGLFNCLLSGQDIHESAPIFNTVTEQMTKRPTMMLRHFCPHMSETDIFWWERLMWAKIFYPATAPAVFRVLLKTKRISEEFVTSMAYRTTYALCMVAGLPAPQGSDPWVKQPV